MKETSRSNSREAFRLPTLSFHFHDWWVPAGGLEVGSIIRKKLNHMDRIIIGILSFIFISVVIGTILGENGEKRVIEACINAGKTVIVENGVLKECK